jgi:hypothetical protein
MPENRRLAGMQSKIQSLVKYLRRRLRKAGIYTGYFGLDRTTMQGVPAGRYFFAPKLAAPG